MKTKPTRPRRSCHDCVFCLTDTLLWARTLTSGFPVAGMCANHPDTPGHWRPVPHSRPCRNFRPKSRPDGIEPPKPTGDDVRYIPLTRGLYALVDASDYEWLCRHKWSVHDTGPGKAQYAVRGCKGRKIFMHRQIMQPPLGMVVDHINRNGLDNRRANLRNCTRQQNLQNRYWRAGRSKYRGVCPQGDKWMATVGYNNQTIYLGLFETEIQAAKARDQKAKQLAGPYAYLNFPEESEEPQIPNNKS